MDERPEDEADKLQQRSDELGEDIDDAREDWQRKIDDAGVPGTPPPGSVDVQEDERAPWPDE